MKAAFINQVGPPENITYGPLPLPVITGSQVLVKVHAVSLNPVDTYIRGGMVKMDLPMPFIVGCDLAGVVEAVGPTARHFQLGDRVWGTNQGLLGRQGTFAEYAAVDEHWLYPTPETVSDEQAAAVALVGITAHLGLVREANLRAGETLFVNGGSGGVGSTVIQMAKAIGARVIATAGGPAKMTLCKQLGADHVLDYRSGDVEASVKKLAPGGVNVWWETTREPNFELSVSCLASHGRIIVMAGREAKPPFPVGPFYVKCASLHGFVMFTAHPDEQRDAADDIARWMVEGKLRARVDRVMPLAEAAAAHRLQEESTVGRSGALSGKIVLKP